MFLLSCDGSEAVALTDVEGNVPSARGLNALQWLPDGRLLAFLIEDPETEDERKRREEKDDPILFEQNPKYVRLWTVDAQTRSVSCVAPDKLQIWEFAWHPNSGEFAAIVSDVPYEWAWYTNRVVRFERNAGTGTGASAQIVWQSRRQVAFPVWSPDGSRMAFISSNWSDRGCVAGDAAGGEARDVSVGIHYDTSPYEPNGLFQKFFSLSYADRLNTATLILHGEVDRDVPVEQSYLFFLALKDKNVPTELIVYPREAHSATERSHPLDMANRVPD